MNRASTDLCEAIEFTNALQRVESGGEYSVIDEQYLLEKLHSIEPDRFEHFIADCWSQMGYNTHVVPDEDDLGVDIVARKDTVFPTKLLLQIKRWAPDETIGLGEVQRYSGLAHDEGADEVYLVTTADFTNNAREWADDKPIELVPGSRLAGLIRNKENLDAVADRYID